MMMNNIFSNSTHMLKMKHFRTLMSLGIVVFLFSSCGTKNSVKEIDVQGHRGARGLAPENSIPGFILAIDIGVNTLELDLVVSKDSLLVVSHEPYFSSDFCLANGGNAIPKDSTINMYELTHDEIKKFDCGSIGNPRFPDQEKISVYKPLFSEVIDSVESYIKNKKLNPVFYNVELKTKKSTDEKFHPSPESFADLVYEMVSEKKIKDRVIIQSFDFRTLQYFNSKFPEVKLALLIENELSWRNNLDSLGFKPGIYSCYYKLLSQQKVQELQLAEMEVIPWTVNNVEDIEEVLAWGVDGIISDYPNRVITITKKE